MAHLIPELRLWGDGRVQHVSHISETLYTLCAVALSLAQAHQGGQKEGTEY